MRESNQRMPDTIAKPPAQPRQSGWLLGIKAAIDHTAALFGIVVLSPLFLCVSVLVWLSVGYPVIFRQTRPGRFGRPFTVYKFRTMSLATDQSGKLLPDSERLTRLGRWIGQQASMNCRNCGTCFAVTSVSSAPGHYLWLICHATRRSRRAGTMHCPALLGGHKSMVAMR